MMTTTSPTALSENLPYQLPPKIIADLVDAPLTPGASLSPSGEQMLLLERTPLPPIEEVAKTELRLAGIRIDPLTNGASRASYFSGFKIKQLKSAEEIEVTGLPDNPKISNVSWSPNGEQIAFTDTEDHGLALWLVNLKEAKAKKLTEARINDAISGLPYRWFSDGREILFKSILIDRGMPPGLSEIPAGPIIQENKTDVAPVRTYQDLLKNEYDEALFSYYTTAQLYTVDLVSFTTKPFSDPAIISGLVTSPNGEYVLITSLEKPFSYVVPYSNFPMKVSIYDRAGALVKILANIPHSENIPKGFGAVRTGPRSFRWRTDQPATLYWVEAQDEGDPKKEVPIRDVMYTLTSPFAGKGEKSISFKLRYGEVEWADDNLALSYEWWWANRQMITSSWQPAHPEKGTTTIFDRSWEDTYHSPGSFETERNAFGRMVLMRRKDDLFLIGQGASPEGNRPFIDRFNLKTKKATRLWRSTAPYYESPVSIKKISEGIVITRRESEEEPANYFERYLDTGQLTQITAFKNPYEILQSVKKELVQYKRADGVDLTGILYTPPGYDQEKDGTLPVLMWAYPREFKSANAAGQVKNSPYEFTRIGWYSPIFWALQGYAIFDDFGMPIVGEDKAEPNETFVEQLVMDAEAAIKVLTERGIADPQRIAVGGHSYGAFMTANLLAHTNLFAAGIARSGAYNRTLTPFGFQSEERTFWEAADTYIQMSPFVHADKIKTPLLLVHGEADNNSGTYPMQSERFYRALKGHGAPVRLVMLPHESHSYQARESIMHMLWEMDSWLKRHVMDREVL